MEETDLETRHTSALERIRSLVDENRQLQMQLEECRNNGMAMLPHQIRLYARLAQFMVEQNGNLHDVMIGKDSEMMGPSFSEKQDVGLRKFNKELNDYLATHASRK